MIAEEQAYREAMLAACKHGAVTAHLFTFVANQPVFADLALIDKHSWKAMTALFAAITNADWYYFTSEAWIAKNEQAVQLIRTGGKVLDLPLDDRYEQLVVVKHYRNGKTEEWFATITQYADYREVTEYEHKSDIAELLSNISVMSW